MQRYDHYLMSFISPILLLILSCTLPAKSTKTHGRSGLISTPTSYYSTPKARSLAERYKDNLDRMVERIVKTPRTSSLQFANNIASVGGIGFFTHSATKTGDERYLEVVLGVPDTFTTKGVQDEKFASLFDLYGQDLLVILSSDSAIYEETEVAGYGLNFSWRSVVSEGATSRVILERAIVYAAKDKVRSFLRHEMNYDGLLAEAVIFAGEENSALRLVSYRPQAPTPHYRPAVQEETIIAKGVAPTITPKGAASRERSALRSEVARNETIPSTKGAAASALPQKLHESSASTSPPEAPTSREEAKSRDPRMESKQHNDSFQSAPSKHQSVNESSPGSAITQSLTTRSAAVTKEKTAELAGANMAGPAVKPVLDKGQTVAVSSVASKTKDGSPEPSMTAGKAAENLRTKEVVENKPTRQEASSKSPESLATAPSHEHHDGPAKSTSPVIKPISESSKPASSAAAERKHQPLEGPQRHEVALKSAPKSDPLSPLTSRAIEGYIVQLAFEEKNQARRWAETLERRGHAVSVTMPAGGETIRVRIGSFSQREEAERQLQRLRQEGLSGIVLNLPQPYRREIHPASDDSMRKSEAAMQSNK